MSVSTKSQAGAMSEAADSLIRIRVRVVRITRRLFRAVAARGITRVLAVALFSLFLVVLFLNGLRPLSHPHVASLENDIPLAHRHGDDSAVDGAVAGKPDPRLIGVSSDIAARRARAAAAERAANHSLSGTRSGGTLGNRFCVLQPTLSAGRDTWDEAAARQHIALRAFMRTFVSTVRDSEKRDFRFAIYYGHDSDDPVFGDFKLRHAFEDQARTLLRTANFSDGTVELVFTPLYGLHSRVNAIWNFMAKDAYYDGCDYFFMSNDDMVFFTPGWVTSAVQSLDGIGSPPGSKRPCRYFGIVRFKDEWADWATFTFHVSTRLHLEIFGGVYYPVPYNSAHNDYWIHFVYSGFGASKFRGEVKVRNRVDDVDFALSHQKDTKHVAPPRYQYDKKGNVNKYIWQGRARVKAWLKQNRGSEHCMPPL